MPSFHWAQAPIDAERRFDGWVGDPAWRGLTRALAAPTGWPAAFDVFMQSTRALRRTPGPRVSCVFVSHQQADVHLAERIAWRADQSGFDYWLDVHDPALRLANSSSLPPPVHSILVAAIIEMALLNATHVVSVQTANAARSRWVPYEFGRGKAHLLVSDQAASWFASGLGPSTSADYLHLGGCLYSEPDVVGWFNAQVRKGCLTTTPSWSRPTPPRLP